MNKVIDSDPLWKQFTMYSINQCNDTVYCRIPVSIHKVILIINKAWTLL